MPNRQTELFVLAAASKRAAGFISDYLRAALLGEDTFDDAERTAKQMRDFMKDATASLAEIERLYRVLDGLRRRHMPLAGEAGAPVVCTTCSMHGAPTPWPCETYKTVDSAMPEGWPQ